ncbi:MAG TPA: sigma-70 family RNA polymerase sigma factor [Marmoricola sp.]|nr:sigma-70 family RNA polymerase sigma factor [Marmoricola sp.]
MTTVGPGTTAAAATDWVTALSLPGPEQDEALRALHALLLRAARRQVQRMAPMLAGSGGTVTEELANQAADEALMALLGKLHTFEGRSRFTTWAYKFAVLQAATAVRSLAWQDRDICLDGLDPADTDPAPGAYLEARDLGAAVRAALDTELTPHQRRVVVALLVDEVPIDVLAERLATNRNALYKTLHDARKRLRAHLRAAGFLDQPDQPQAGTP